MKNIINNEKTKARKPAVNPTGFQNKLLHPVKMDVFVHDPKVLADVREALEQGLKPVTFSLIGDSVVLRLERKPLQEEALARNGNKLLLGNR